jgi:hypothetical protein
MFDSEAPSFASSFIIQHSAFIISNFPLSPPPPRLCGPIQKRFPLFPLRVLRALRVSKPDKTLHRLARLELHSALLLCDFSRFSRPIFRQKVNTGAIGPHSQSRPLEKERTCNLRASGSFLAYLYLRYDINHGSETRACPSRRLSSRPVPRPPGRSELRRRRC